MLEASKSFQQYLLVVGTALCTQGAWGFVRLLHKVEYFAESMPYGPAESYQRSIPWCPAVSLCHGDFIALRKEKEKVSCGLSGVEWLS